MDAPVQGQPQILSAIFSVGKKKSPELPEGMVCYFCPE
jgi:hypothetical protein